MEIQDDNAICQPQGQTSRHIETSTNSKGWQCWDYFNITERSESWILKKSNARKLIDRDIMCAVLDENGQECNWKTTDSKRQSSTSNMIEHLRKRHSIEAQDRPESAKKLKPTINIQR
ncbi:hypothetical protein V1523DRAFT_240498 [Lipomyces doorenjongii]